MPYRGKLIASGADAKTIKGNGEKYETAIMYLMPDDILCPWSKRAKCKDPCLVSAGRGKFSNVEQARIRKSNLYHNDRDTFMDMLQTDIHKFRSYCHKRDIQPCVRPNGTSDIPFERVPVGNKTIMEEFDDVIFYDYTKTVNRVYKDPYPLTLSYSGADPVYQSKVEKAMQELPDVNVAVVFRTQQMLHDAMDYGFMGREVIHADKDDMRFLDPKGTIAGLVAKGSAKTDTSGFVVDYDRSKSR